MLRGEVAVTRMGGLSAGSLRQELRGRFRVRAPDALRWPTPQRAHSGADAHPEEAAELDYDFAEYANDAGLYDEYTLLDIEYEEDVEEDADAAGDDWE
eukprot:jgi/Ulvmu1/1009/UM103_0037.1